MVGQTRLVKFVGNRKLPDKNSSVRKGKTHGHRELRYPSDGQKTLRRGQDYRL